MEFSPPKIPGVISLFPTLPANGAIIDSPLVKFAICVPFFTNGYLSKSIELIRLSFFILIEKD
jgi:hypothetical protein